MVGAVAVTSHGAGESSRWTPFRPSAPAKGHARWHLKRSAAGIELKGSPVPGERWKGCTRNGMT